MKSIRIKDLEIIEQEKAQQDLPQKNLAFTVSQLTIEIAKLKGAVKNV